MSHKIRIGFYIVIKPVSFSLVLEDLMLLSSDKLYGDADYTHPLGYGYLPTLPKVPLGLLLCCSVVQNLLFG